MVTHDLRPWATTELLHELTEIPDDFGSRDRVQRATRDVVAVGIIHRNGEFMVPGRAAVHELLS